MSLNTRAFFKIFIEAGSWAEKTQRSRISTNNVFIRFLWQLVAAFGRTFVELFLKKFKSEKNSNPNLQMNFEMC